jgi:hypothetical protein
VMLNHLKGLRNTHPRVSPNERYVSPCVQKKVAFVELDPGAAERRVIPMSKELNPALLKCDQVYAGNPFKGTFESV